MEKTKVRFIWEDWKDKLFAVVEFDETKITAEELAFDLTNDYKDYAVRALTSDEAKSFLREFTNCPEVVNADTTSTFTLRPEITDTIGNTTPAYTITL